MNSLRFRFASPDGTTDADFCFNENYQVVEVRKNSDTDAAERYLWDETYIDAPAMVELDTNTDGTRDYRLWPTWDANFNVTGMLSDSGVTVERYAYTPYGQQIVLNGDQNYANSGADPDGTEWTVDTNGSDFGFVGSGFQGLRLDGETGNWYQRARYSNPALGAFQQRDPQLDKYQDGFNLNLITRANPVKFLDSHGLEAMTAFPLATVNWGAKWHFLQYVPGPQVGGDVSVPTAGPNSPTAYTITAVYIKYFQRLWAACDILDQLFFFWGPIQRLTGSETSTPAKAVSTGVITGIAALPIGKTNVDLPPIYTINSFANPNSVKWGGKRGEPRAVDAMPADEVPVGYTPVAMLTCGCIAANAKAPNAQKLP